MAASRPCAAAAAPSLPTYWCLELLHECFPDLALPPLPPHMVAGAPEGYRHRIELRALEAWLESVGIVPNDPTPPPAPAAVASPPFCIFSSSCSPREVLGRLHLIVEIYGREGVESLAYDVRKYIHDKRASLPKLCIHLLKEVGLGLQLDHKESEETRDSSTLASNRESPSVFTKRESPCVLHRKRVLWTEDEVKALKYFAGEFREGQNIPWRKIKKYGEDIFNKERSPNDLKDKWKNLKKRAKIP